MLRTTPLKNSKSVNKPFKSPFDSAAQKKEQTKLFNKDRVVKQDDVSVNSPLSSRSLEVTKRVLLLDEDEKPSKKSKTENDDGDKAQMVVPENATKQDLLTLKRKIFEIRQELDRLKSREQCSKKHDPKELKLSINKWLTGCQSALETICLELTEKNGQSCTIPQVLSMLGIPADIVRYSEKDDGFIQV